MAKKLSIDGHGISVKEINGQSYISLTDLAKAGGNADAIPNWLRNRNTVEFLKE